MNAIRRRKLLILKLSCARILVSQENFGWLRSLHFEMAHQGRPGSAGPRAQVHHAVSAALFQADSQQVRDRLISLRDVKDHLQLVDELIPQELREPWLFVNFK
jgi:hypothetical protein